MTDLKAVGSKNTEWDGGKRGTRNLIGQEKKRKENGGEKKKND